MAGAGEGESVEFEQDKLIFGDASAAQAMMSAAVTASPRSSSALNSSFARFLSRSPDSKRFTRATTSRR
jgi:hypothetical protein